MAKEMKDETFGTIKGKIPIYKNGLDESGEIIICESGIIVRAEGNTVRAPYTHVKILGKSVEMALGKKRLDVTARFEQSGQTLGAVNLGKSLVKVFIQINVAALPQAIGILETLVSNQTPFLQAR